MKLLQILATTYFQWQAGCVLLLSSAPRTPLQDSLHSEIAKLAAAVETGDVQSVNRITTLLTAEASRRSADKSRHNSSTSKALADSFTAPRASHVLASLGKARKDACILDDHIFRLTPEAKEELSKELEAKEIKEGLQWVQTGGWFHCADYGYNCTCHGDVRMVDKNDAIEPLMLPLEKRKDQSTELCDISSFGEQAVTQHPKACECKQKEFHLQKRLSSKSYLQEAWIFLLRLLGNTGLLPAGTGDRTYHGMENWGARGGQEARVLERIWIDMFVQKVVSVHAPWGRCLEWGDPRTPGSGFHYVTMVPGCQHNVDIQYDAIYHGHKAMGTIENNVVYSDIEHLPQVLKSTWLPQGDSRMNVIFATQVFEHLSYPLQGAKDLFESLLPGGALVYSAPQQAQFHKVPHDYFRYTKEGSLHLLLTAGFCVPPWAMVGGGDFIFDIARDAGLQAQDFPNEEIANAFQVGYHAISDSAITIHAIAFKPPHNACSQSMR